MGRLTIKWYAYARKFTDDTHATCDIMLGMRFLPMFGCCERSSRDSEEKATGAVADNGAGGDAEIEEESHFLKTVGWVSAALGAVALGLIVGREIRQRYKFNRQTPYDLYAHSGDELPDVDCGVGI
jgi:hypothetical protein